MVSASLILLVLSLACLGVAAVSDRSPNWNRLIAAGLALFVASMLVR